MKSMTYALKAQNVLQNNAIYSRIIKLDATKTKKGCAYGLEVGDENLNNAIRLLDINKINYSEIVR